MRRLTLYLNPYLGKMPINMTEAQDLLATVKPVVDRGKLLLARKLIEMCGRIFRYAVATGRAKHNVAAELRGALPTHHKVHRVALIDKAKIGKMLLDIDNYVGSFQIQCAMKLLPLVFVRSGELSKATWDEVDFEKAEWRIKAERMKMKEVHIVPLSRQALELFRNLHKFSGSYKYVFPSIHTNSKPIGHTSLINALCLLGYSKEEHSTHGFRSIVSTFLNEMGYNFDWIERQLAHRERNEVRASYNYAQYLPERRKMMQEWSDYLYELKEKARAGYTGYTQLSHQKRKEICQKEKRM